MLQWLSAESNRLNSEKLGLINCEMYVQEGSQMSFAYSKVSIYGLVDMGQFCEDLSILNTHKKNLHLASCILQFVFFGYDGFRFPVIFFPWLWSHGTRIIYKYEGWLVVLGLTAL